MVRKKEGHYWKNQTIRLVYVWRKRVSNVIEIDNITIDLVNFDQTIFSYVTFGKYIFSPPCAKTVPTKVTDDKTQITETFSVTMMGKLLSVQVSYEGKTHRWPPNFESPKYFNVTYCANHRSNAAK